MAIGPIDADNIRIQGSVPFANLEDVGDSDYVFVVKIYNSLGVLISNPGIPNPYTVEGTVSAPVSGISTFSLLIPITPGPYNLTDLQFRVFANEDSDCCYGVEIADINNSAEEGVNCGWGPTIVGDLAVSPTSITFLMDAGGVFQVGWKIKKGSVVVRSGVTNMTNTDGSNVFTPSNRPIMTFSALLPDTYTFEIEGANCVSSAPSIRTFTISSEAVEATSVGAYKTEIGGRTFTYTKAKGLVLQFNSDGTFSDVTPGLTWDGNTNIYEGRRRFYQIGGRAFRNSGGSYNRMQNIYLADGIVKIIVYDVLPSEINNISEFITHCEGFNQKLTNTTCRFRDMSLGIKSTLKVGSGSEPEWLCTVSRYMNFPTQLAPKSWRPWRRWVSPGLRNKGDLKSTYVALGLCIDQSGASGAVTDMYWGSTYPTDSELYSLGASKMIIMGSDPQSALTSQFEEDMYYRLPGYDGSIGNHMKHYYRGAKDILNGVGVTNIRDMGLFGEYGQENIVNPYTLYGQGRTVFQQSLTTHVRKQYRADGTGWISADDEYYSRGDYLYRNINDKLYFPGLGITTPYLALYYQERLSLGTYDYGGRKMVFYTMPYLEDLGYLPSGQAPPIFAHEGEIIPYPGGEVRTNTPEYHAALWDEMFTAGFWYTLLAGGAIMWGNGVEPGNDITKIATFGSIDGMAWTPTGGSEGSFNPGVNGAPTYGDNAMFNRHISGCVDALMAGAEEAYKLRNRFQNLKMSAYYSDRDGGYTPTGGTNGTFLNTESLQNLNFFDLYDLVDLKKGLCISGSGGDGGFFAYYNGYLGQHETENITALSQPPVLVYGRQTVIKTFGTGI